MATDFADRWGFPEDKFWLRGERPKEPVEWSEELKRWEVYGYDEVNEALSNNDSYTADSAKLFNIDEETAKYFDGDLAQMSGPEHTNIRKQVSHAFSPTFIDHLQLRARELAEQYATELKDMRKFNLLSDFVDHVAGIVFSELLGIPADDRRMFRVVDQNMDQQAAMTTVNEGTENDYFEALTKPLQPLREMLGKHVDAKLADPKEDLISLLCQVEKLDGNQMTRDQIINFIIGILGAGHLATPLLTANTLLCLESFPAEFDKIKADHSLIPGMLEESMRFLTPGAVSYRATLTEVDLGGHRIPADSLLRVYLGAANRDPNQFPNPDVYDVTRKPNAHLGFGRGAHYCVGSQMVRVETRVVFEVLLERFPKLRVDPDITPLFFNSPDFTGVRSGGMWVRVD
ncbi:cytochrome P450 [Streptacidiphilus pinicola]|uniref:Cytochrome P450 n=1 Tax=Streptacidiphilus pinicola TaxID=2219663 RepID=A0A2X0IIX4_9ACTN|nr:cytochrome P450 [Streptacidiphilus pinicola]RAG85064.1 cytochrome P450 [Streptacidiphilus pinicola]